MSCMFKECDMGQIKKRLEKELGGKGMERRETDKQTDIQTEIETQR